MSGRGDASLAPTVPEGWGYEYKAISRPGELLHMTEPFGLNEDNSDSGVYDGIGDNGPKRKGSSVAALTIAYYKKTQVHTSHVSSVQYPALKEAPAHLSGKSEASLSMTQYKDN